jgi:hypothetical protein
VSEGGENRTPSGRARRRLLAGLGAVLVVVLAGGVWALATMFESPAQRAAHALPPSPGPLLAEVRSGVLERTVSTAAVIALEREQAVPIAAASAIGAGAAAASVVTATTEPGSALSAGIRVVEVNGRPRLATSGAFRYYRDLSLGMSGPDVRQLQTFLGLDPDGLFGSAVEKAVRRMYAQAGYATMTAETDPPAGGAPVDPAKPGGVTPVTPPPALLVPAGELLVFNTFPAYVVSAPPVGDLPTDATLAVESGGFVARADVPLSFAHQMKNGLPVTVRYEDATMDGTVQGVGDAPSASAATGGADGQADPHTSSDQKRVSYRLSADAPVDFAWRGREVVVTAVVSSVATKSLIVPSIAVVTDRGGSAHVRKRRPDGSFVEIAVTEIATLDGKSAITTSKTDALIPGDLVRTA